MDCDWGFLKNVYNNSFSKLTVILIMYAPQDTFLSGSFGLCCLKVIPELTLCCIARRGE